MKQFILFLVVLLALISTGCSNSVDDIDVINNETVNTINHQRISKEDAIGIANKVLKKTTTRGERMTIPTFEYVMSNNITRNSTLPDTLAYILNYPNNSGFVIVAADRRVYPVLAYSKEGSFNLDNEIAKTNFIDRVEYYMEEADPNSSYEYSENDLDKCGGVYNGTGISLGQSEPWNKYLVQEYPRTPLGCVTVATALVMSYTKSSFTYHGTNFELKPIIEAIHKGQAPKYNSPKRIVNGEVPVYSYEQAVDIMARFMYWLGKDLGVNYETDSSANSVTAYLLLQQFGFKVSGYYSYNIDAIVNYLLNNNIIYLRGIELNNEEGHAWVSDGCTYCINSKTGQFENVYLHCNWGWSGYCDGYYSGSVFIADMLPFKPLNYFAVKKEY